MTEQQELEDLIYRHQYPEPDNPRIQPLAERSRWEQDMITRTAAAVIAAGYTKG